MFERLSVGDEIDAGVVEIDEHGASGAIRWAGYTHPLFASPALGRPVPGELVLLLLGGLAERSGIFDESVIALVETRSVRFQGMAVAGDSLRLRMKVNSKLRTRSGVKGLLTFSWICTKAGGDPVLEAEMVFLVEA